MRVRGCFGHYTTEDKPFYSGSAAELFRCTSGGYIYKKYKTRRHDLAAIARLHWVRDLGRQILVDGRQQAGSTPEASVNWPIDIVEDISMGVVSGVIIPEIPHRFYRSTGERRTRTLDWLILARSNPPRAATRLAVLIRLAEIFAFLDKKGLVHGDLSVTNVVWCENPQPGAYLVDCDGLKAHSAPSPHGLVTGDEWITPDWIDPRRIEKVISAHDRYSDWYALALAMYRGLFLNKGNLSKNTQTKTWPKPAALPRGLAPQIKDFLERSLGHPLDAHARPSPHEWVTALVATFVTNNSYDTRKLKVLEDHAQKYRDEHQPLSKGFTPTQSRQKSTGQGGIKQIQTVTQGFIKRHKALFALAFTGALIVAVVNHNSYIALDAGSGPIGQLEQRLREHPGAFDWHVHNELRHLYSTSNPPNLRKAMEHSNVILQHSIMDDYILRILSEWQIDKDISTARANLMKNAQSFPDLRFLAAACFLKIGELYAAEGNREDANASYLKIMEDKSMLRQYRTLAEEKLKGRKDRKGLPEALLPQITIGPWTINKKPEQ